MDKLTMHELTKRLDNEFEDIDLTIHTSPTKGTVAVVYFYEDKLEDNEDDWPLIIFMITYKGKKVTAKVKAKHIVSDEVMKIFDNLKKNPELLDSDWQYLTSKEEDSVLDYVSIFEDKIHKLLGVKFKQIISSNNYTKSI